MLQHRNAFVGSRRQKPRGFIPNLIAYIYSNADLGWTPGQNITSALATALSDGTLSAGGALFLEHMYDIDSGANLVLPDDFTIAGDAAGSGLTVVNVLLSPTQALTFGARNTLRDATVMHTGVEPEGTKTNSTSFDGNDDLSIINSYFGGNAGTFLDDIGDRLTIRNSHFNGGYWAVTPSGTDTAEIRDSLFENSLGDGIKTTKAGKTTSNILVSGCVFLNCTRDGIDVTGGFRDSVVENSYFVKNMLGMDIKSHYTSTDDFGKSDNFNILIKNSEFITNNRAVVIATTDDSADQVNEQHLPSSFLTNENWSTYCTRDVRMENSIVEYDTNVGHQNGSDIFHIKGGQDILYDTIQTYGNIDAFLVDDGWRYGNIDPGVYNANYSGTGLTNDPSPRPAQPDSYYRGLAGTVGGWSLSL